ncbi:MAG: Outer membrane protein assembly factor BamB [Verrucomicrobia subdivision 3 bacterium]|nr:Outer membrane protein assembly factor BamB [Limisphaerales bacterium]MCS1416569.1 Outer membrane protein assembly factor BamB [Limisphaerales bacterium]
MLKTDEKKSSRLLLTLALAAQAAEHWNQFRGPQSNDVSSAPQITAQSSETQNIRWLTEIHAQVWSSPVVWDNLIWLTATKENGAACLNTWTGETLWENHDLKYDHHVRPASSPIIDGNLFFLIFNEGNRQFIATLDKPTGKMRWRQNRKVNSDSGKVLQAGGIKDANQVQKQQANDNRKSYATPAVIEHEGRRQLISPAAEVTIAYDPTTGKELWRKRLGSRQSHWSLPVHADGRIYFLRREGTVAVIAVSSDSTLAINQLDSNFMAGPAIVDRFGSPGSKTARSCAGRGVNCRGSEGEIHPSSQA